MKPPSKTPRTEAAEEGSFGIHNNSLSARAAGWAFARKLETELTDLKDDFIYLRNENLRLKEENNQLKQGIAALNKEPTNSL